MSQRATAYDPLLVEPSPGQPATKPARAFDRWLLTKVHANVGVPLRMILWDGTKAWSTHPLATLRVADRKTLLDLARDPELGFGDAYAAGRLEVEGNLTGFLTALFRAQAEAGDAKRKPWRAWNDVRAARQNAQHHYDVGNDFFRLWLDEEMVYTCAYFPDKEATLEEAQRAKMRYVCRKMGVKPGDRVVEAGCGWGALALTLARDFGALVRAYNVSTEQIRYARARAEKEGLSDRVEFIEDDYRSIQDRCDVFVSVGMLEHVGPRCYPELGEVIDRCLDPQHGRGLLHFIGRNRPAPLNAWIEKRIFPGAYPPTVDEAIRGVLEPHELSVLDVENLRRHYAKTAAHWRTRFEEAATEIGGRHGDHFLRSWRLYLAGTEAAFAAGTLQLFQITFARPRLNDIAWTRAGLYQD